MLVSYLSDLCKISNGLVSITTTYILQICITFTDTVIELDLSSQSSSKIKSVSSFTCKISTLGHCKKFKGLQFPLWYNYFYFLKRNPDIKLCGLPWGFPGWLGSGNWYPYENNTRTAEYIIKWIKGAAHYHGLNIDYVGVRYFNLSYC